MSLAFSRFTWKVALRVLVCLRGTDANCVFNSHNINIPKIGSVRLRGFVGVEDSEAHEVQGAFCYGSGEDFVSVVFGMAVSERVFTFNFSEIPEDWTVSDAEIFVKRVLKSVAPKVDERMYERMVSRKKGGRYWEPRLEAHRRDKNLPNPKWNRANPRFTQEFKELAGTLNVTYK